MSSKLADYGYSQCTSCNGEFHQSDLTGTGECRFCAGVDQKSGGERPSSESRTDSARTAETRPTRTWARPDPSVESA